MKSICVLWLPTSGLHFSSSRTLAYFVPFPDWRIRQWRHYPFSSQVRMNKHKSLTMFACHYYWLQHLGSEKKRCCGTMFFLCDNKREPTFVAWDRGNLEWEWSMSVNTSIYSSDRYRECAAGAADGWSFVNCLEFCVDEFRQTFMAQNYSVANQRSQTHNTADLCPLSLELFQSHSSTIFIVCPFLCPVPGKLDKMGKIVGLTVHPNFKKMTKIKTFTADSGAFAELGPAGIGKPFFISKKPASLCQ